MTAAALIAMRGGIASGKSTLAAEIGQRLDIPLVSADGVRAALSLDTAFPSDRHEVGRPGGAHTDPPSEIYAEVMRRADRLLCAGWGVVLDGCFATSDQRQAARALAGRHGVPFLLVECQVEPDVLRDRLSARDARDELPPGSWLQLARSLDAQREAASELSPREHLVVDGAELPETLVERVIRPRLDSFIPGPLVSQKGMSRADAPSAGEARSA